jgi:ribosomal protein S27E
VSQPQALGRFTYQRHEPEDTVLYQIVSQNLETFLRLVQEETGHPLPDFVVKEFRDYLKCGILAHGFLRVQCQSCQNEHLVAFSCKRRGFCPSCGGRRMSETAIHLVEQVLPVKPIRQWVMSFPIQLRLLLAIRPKIMAQVLHITHESISSFLCKKAGLNKSQAKTGAVTLIQRFGGSINLNIHFHQLYIDGVYELDANQQPSTFHMTPAPTVKELAQVLEKIITKVTRLLERKGIIFKEEPSFQLEISDDDSFAKLQAGAVNYRFAMGPNKGKRRSP